MTAPGQWAGQSSGGSVRPGDAVTVGVAADYELRVVWESQDGDASEVYAEDSGPGA